MAKVDPSSFFEESLARGCARRDPVSIREFVDYYGSALGPSIEAARRELELPEVPVDRVLQRAARSVGQRIVEWPEEASARPSVPEFLERLRLPDLVLAVGCTYGIESAWQVFDTRYAAFVRISARHFARHAADVSEIVESFYADLFLPRSGGGGNPISGFHGWAKLKTWLRTVLLYRVNDYYGRPSTPEIQLSVLDDSDGGTIVRPSQADSCGAELPAAEEYMSRSLRDRVDRAIATVIDGLDPAEAELIVKYYVEGRTVVELGRSKGVHKASVSRWLKRLRQRILHGLRRDLGSDFPQSEEELYAMLEVLGRSDSDRTPGLGG